MAGDDRYTTVMPYVMTGNRQVSGTSGGCGEIKVRIRVPMNMPPPKEIVGVVLTPEISYSEPAGEGIGAFGWLETLIYYEPYYPGAVERSSADYTMIENEESECFSALPESEAGPLPFDDYFTDLSRSTKESVIEVVGQEKELIGDQMASVRGMGGSQENTCCLTHRVPFYLSLGELASNEELSLIPQVENVECIIRSPRLLDLQVTLNLFPPVSTAAEEALEPTEVLVDAVAPAAAEESEIIIWPDTAASRQLDVPVWEEEDAPAEADLSEPLSEEEVDTAAIEEPGFYEEEEHKEESDEFEAETGSAEPVEEIAYEKELEQPHPSIGIGYQNSIAPRRPSRRRPGAGLSDGGVRRPRTLAKAAAAKPDIQPAESAVAPKTAEPRVHRAGRRQSTAHKYQMLKSDQP